jgi:hypothetical protein
MRVREIANRLASIYIDVPALRPGTIGAYLLAFASVGIATALRLAIHPYVEGLQFATFLPAVIITTLIGGLGAGLFSVVLSVAAAAFFVLPPRLSFYVEKPGDVLALLLYTVVMLFTVVLITGMRFAFERGQDQQALQASKDRLQAALNAARLGSWRYDPRHRVFLGCEVEGDFRRHRGWGHRRSVHELGASRRCGKGLGGLPQSPRSRPTGAIPDAVPAPVAGR